MLPPCALSVDDPWFREPCPRQVLLINTFINDMCMEKNIKRSRKGRGEQPRIGENGRSKMDGDDSPGGRNRLRDVVPAPQDGRRRLSARAEHTTGCGPRPTRWTDTTLREGGTDYGMWPPPRKMDGYNSPGGRNRLRDVAPALKGSREKMYERKPHLFCFYLSNIITCTLSCCKHV